MGTHRSRILIVEGTSGVGKSTLIDALIRRLITDAEQNKIRTFLHLAQAHTYGPIAPYEDDGTLTKEQNLLHLESIYQILLWHVKAVEKEKAIKFFCIIDTLHITHCFRPGILCWEDVADFDRQMAELGCKLIFLHPNQESIWRRSIEPRKGKQFLEEYAQKFGRTYKEICIYFVDEQKKMEEVAQKSQMQRRFFSNDDPVENMIDKAYRFWLGAPLLDGARDI